MKKAAVLVSALALSMLITAALRPGPLTVKAAFGSSKTLTGVPAYTWRHGCAPTAVGMVIGYYDKYPEYQDLIPGDASTQTPDVDQAIASQSNDPTKPRHYEDYAFPEDSSDSIKPDKSEPPAGDEHPNDCIADFMKTSRSALGLAYGETWANNIGPGFVDYVNFKNPSYGPYYREYLKADFQGDLQILEAQIDNDRPMVFVIDEEGTGKYDDAVTVIGYKTESGALYYGCIDTATPTETKWFFIYESSGKPGAVWGAYSFGLKPKNPVGDISDSQYGSMGCVECADLSFNAKKQEVLITHRLMLQGLDLSGSYQVNGKTVTGLDIRNRWEQGIEGIWSGWYDIKDFDYTYTIRTEVIWAGPGEAYDVGPTVVTGIGRSDTSDWYTDEINAGDDKEGAKAAHEVGHYFGLYDEYDPALGAVVDPKKPIRDDGSIMGLCGEPRLRHYEMFLKWLQTASGRTNMILAPAPVLPGPVEPIPGFSEPSGIAPFAKPGGPYIAEEGYPMDFDGTSSHDLDGTIVSYKWDFGDGSTPSASPTPTHTYEDGGVFVVTLAVTDDDGLIGRAATLVTVADTTPPSVAMVSPPSGYALQDGVTFTASATDIGSGVKSVTFSVREDNGGDGIPIGFEDLSGTRDPVTGNWNLWFDTLQLQDGYYLVVVKAMDNAGNVGSVTVQYSIRNWAVVQLLPSTPANKAGRTMPVKFSLRVAASADPSQPFVYNEDLTIKIYATNNPSNVLQTSVFGVGSRYYRIDVPGEKYITNFQTSKTPATYIVEIWRMDKNFLVGSFTFQTVK